MRRSFLFWICFIALYIKNANCKDGNDGDYNGWTYTDCLTIIDQDERQICITFVLWQSIQYPTGLNLILSGQLPPWFDSNVVGRITPVGDVGIPIEVLEYFYGGGNSPALFNLPNNPDFVIYDTASYYVTSSGLLWILTLINYTYLEYLNIFKCLMYSLYSFYLK